MTRRRSDEMIIPSAVIVNIIDNFIIVIIVEIIFIFLMMFSELHGR